MRFRAGATASVDSPVKVDREKGIIYGASVIQSGEALGHDMTVDATTLSQVCDLGQASGDAGIQMRYGHPGMCDDAIAQKLGRAKNFQIDGDKVRADLHLGKYALTSPKGDLYTHTLDLAESDPSGFGCSIAFDCLRAWKLPGGGESETEERPKNAIGKTPFARANKLHAVDTVNEPAANRDGLFGVPSLESFSDLIDAPAGERAETAFAALDDLAKSLGADGLNRLSLFANRYFAARNVRASTISMSSITTAALAAPQEKVPRMKLSAQRMAELCAEHPAQAVVISKMFAADASESDVTTAILAAKSEILLSKVAELSAAITAKDAEIAAEKAKLSALSVKHEALSQSHKSLSSLGSSASDPGGAPLPVAGAKLEGEAAWRAEFKNDDALREEFGQDIESYVAFKKHDMKGQI